MATANSDGPKLGAAAFHESPIGKNESWFMHCAMNFTGAAWLILGALGALPAMFACMMFDAPGSAENPATQALFWSVFLFPAVCFAAVALAWRPRRAGRLGLAWLFLALPLINLAIGFAAYRWIDVMQAGRLAG